MGSEQSKSLAELDASEISNAIKELGSKYDGYANTSKDNGVDGKLLAALTEHEFHETLDDLGITNRLHRRVLHQAFDTARQQQQRKGVSVAQSKAAITNFYERVPETFGFSRATPPEDRMAFDEIAQDAMYHCSSPSTIYVGVHLVTHNGQISLASLIRDMHGNVTPITAHNTEAMSMCAAIVKYEHGTTFTKRKLWENLYLPEQGGEKQWYTGHVFMDEGENRIGMVCIIDKGDGTGLDDEDRILLLQKLTADVEYQLKLRLVLLNRNNKSQ
jgi:hypothetical protein